MLLFGHLGITLGIFFGLRVFIPRLNTVINPWYLAIGAILPDLIDKPLGELIFTSTFGSGRIIGHTLLFSVLLFLASLYLYEKRRDIRGLSLTAGSSLHLFQDQMLASPQIFFWPLFGWEFPRSSSDYIGLEHLIRMFLDSFRPEYLQSYIPELLGVGIIGIVILSVFIKKLEKKISDDI